MSAQRIVSREQPKKKRWWLAALSGNALLVTILVHVFFGVIAAYLVVEHFQKKHVDFHATEPPGPHLEQEHKVQMAKRNSVDSAPPDLKRITTTEVSAITLPDVPEMPKTDDVTPSPISGMDGVLGTGAEGSGMGSGTGFGAGSGSGEGGFGSDAPDANLFTGYFYDLKQTPERKPSGVNDKRYNEIVARYVNGAWDDALLAHYFKSPKPLYTDRFAISTRASEEAPRAFHLGHEVQASCWVARYHGKVKVAKAGDFRLVGFGDNFLVVKVGQTTVLDAGWSQVVTRDSVHGTFPLQWSETYKQHSKNGPRSLLKVGASFHLDAGTPTDMDILLGDDGGVCCFYLLVMNEAGTYEKLPDGTPKIPFFQLAPGEPPSFLSHEEHPPFSTTPEPWQGAGN